MPFKQFKIMRLAISLSFIIVLLPEVCNAQQWGGSNTISGGIYRNGYVNIEGLYITRYGSPLSGDPDPFTLSTAPEINEDHDLTIYGNGSRTLHLRLYDGDFKIGAMGTPNTTLYNNGNAYFNGNVGIGSANPDARLAVNGTIHAEEVLVDLNVPGPDYVFEKDYNLLSLEELEAYINQNKHLPEVPSAKEMEANGLKLMEMNLLLLKKVEELTLHVIELKKENDAQNRVINELREKK